MNNFMKKAIPTAMCVVTLASAVGAVYPNSYAPLEGYAGITYATDENLDNTDVVIQPRSFCIWGTMTQTDDSIVFSKSNGDTDPTPVHLTMTETTKVLDAVTGQPMKIEDIKDTDTVYAYTTAIQESSPAQAEAILLLANIPADFAVPSYHTIEAVQHIMDTDTIMVTTDDGSELMISAEVTIVPHMTLQEVTLQDLVPGSQILTWSNYMPEVGVILNQVMLFPYEYNGFITADESAVVLNGTNEISDAIVVDDMLQIGLREVAEELGYTVAWDNDTMGIVLTLDDNVISINLNNEHVVVNDEVITLDAVPYEEDGSTYFPIDVIADFFDLHA